MNENKLNGGCVHMKVKDPKSAFSTSESSHVDELRKLCFPVNEIITKTAPISTLSRSRDDSCSDVPIAHNSNGTSEISLTEASLDDGSSRIGFIRSIDARQGRTNQRWGNCESTGEIIRLCTGSVPITSNGHIMCVSSSKKKEWILPKGGWELDETLEQCATRETFEEGGVLGILGPRLNAVTFATRKSLMKKESLKTNEAKQKGKLIAPNSSPSTIIETKLNKKYLNDHEHEKSDNVEDINGSCAAPEEINASLCRIHYFPLYVTEVYSEWPEGGRTRKTFTIDDAIATVTREQMKQALMEVKERGLHLCGATYIEKQYQT